MIAKIRIKAGPVEFEYEGQAELSISDIKDLFTHIEMLFKKPALTEANEDDVPEGASNGANAGAGINPPGQKLHVNSIATKLKAKGTAQVALAAAAALQIMDNNNTFTRAELLSMMKKATMHYKDTMSGNLTPALKSLIGPKLNQVNDGVYSLTADAYQELVGQLA